MTWQCFLKGALNQPSKQGKQHNFWKAEMGFMCYTWIESQDYWLNKLVRFPRSINSTQMFLKNCSFNLLLASYVCCKLILLNANIKQTKKE